jgi:hypothetical protein
MEPRRVSHMCKLSEGCDGVVERRQQQVSRNVIVDSITCTECEEWEPSNIAPHDHVFIERACTLCDMQLSVYGEVSWNEARL